MSNPLAHAIAAGTAPTSLSAGPLATTGAALITASVTWYTGGGGLSATPITDTEGNTYAQVGTTETQGIVAVALFACVNPTTGASVTITANFSGGGGGGGNYATLEVAAWASSTGPIFDTSSQGQNNQPGAITPAQNGELLVTAYAPPDAGSGTPSCGSGFAVTDAIAYTSGVNEGGGQAWLIQATAGAINPSWSTTGGGNGPAVIGAWKGDWGGGGTITVAALAMLAGESLAAAAARAAAGLPGESRATARTLGPLPGEALATVAGGATLAAGTLATIVRGAMLGGEFLTTPADPHALLPLEALAALRSAAPLADEALLFGGARSVGLSGEFLAALRSAAETPDEFAGAVLLAVAAEALLPLEWSTAPPATIVSLWRLLASPGRVRALASPGWRRLLKSPGRLRILNSTDE
jgi:hypothetical protein